MNKLTIDCFRLIGGIGPDIYWKLALAYPQFGRDELNNKVYWLRIFKVVQNTRRHEDRTEISYIWFGQGARFYNTKKYTYHNDDRTTITSIYRVPNSMITKADMFQYDYDFDPNGDITTVRLITEYDRFSMKVLAIIHSGEVSSCDVTIITSSDIVLTGMYWLLNPSKISRYCRRGGFRDFHKDSEVKEDTKIIKKIIKYPRTLKEYNESSLKNFNDMEYIVRNKLKHH